jgi:ketosteroid isomerase-like protein
MIGAFLAKRAARKAFAAMNRHDLEAFMSAWSEDAAFEFPGSSILAGRYQGKAAIRAWFSRWWNRFPRTVFTLQAVSVDDIMAFGGTNTVHVEWLLDEMDEQGRTFHLSGVSALHARAGKVVLVKDYIFEQDVIAEAWKDIVPASGTAPLPSPQLVSH